MRSGAAAGHTGYFHQTALYGSDAEFTAIVVPFLRGGIEAGEPTLVTLGEQNTALVRAALPDTTGITFLSGAGQYARPALAIRFYQQLLAEHTDRGARQVRVVGDVPHPGNGAPWDGWARYEAAINRAYDRFPLWGLCPYDTRTTPPAVLADVAATHPLIATADGTCLPNPDYTDPDPFLVDRLFGPPLTEPTRPTLDLPEVTAAGARQAVRGVAAASTLDVDSVDDLMLAVSEAVNNVHTHGVPPARLRIWNHDHRVVAAVTDRGTGPHDPYVGLLPTIGSGSAGLGLWLAHQMCTEVTFHRDHDGFTVRLVMAP